MRKSTKGALAAGGAAVLLLGGAGSLAYWTASGSVAGGTITAGSLALTTPSCGSWTYDTKEATAGATFTPGGTGNGSLLVPGDVVSETCTTTLTATGEHMRGTIVASTPSDITPFTVSVSSITDAVTPISGGVFTEANNGHQLSVTISVTLPSSSDNSTIANQKTLDAIALTATQAHS
ncbi:alternate-type signal peptide domain-containing protein [Nocardioides sp. BP30]|uniref:alternate-type signal peptide domain-containing protein n=1 Tax=Nocardioides sp. BP30 TaxID=3036374 RepID=UPI0024692454|nr:alternate-type signal peptide domain-containing protein [Nocardioides sp. BP30]WGL50405.1 alternate-type signal peptide domain-containing protein [Nocardioides sp. BP30]